MKHQWVPSTLGHGETMCLRCKCTNREAAVLGIADRCDDLEKLTRKTLHLKEKR